MVKKEDKASEFYKNTPVHLLEEKMLGCILFNNDSIVEIIDIFKPEYFSHIKYSKIYKVMVLLYTTDNPIDDAFIINKLSEKGQIDDYCSEKLVYALNNAISSSVNIKKYAEAIIERYNERILSKLPGKINDILDNLDIDPVDKKDKVLDLVLSNINVEKDTNLIPIKDTDPNFLENIQEKIYQEELETTGLDFGFPRLSLSLDGFTNGYLICLAAESQTGKSNLMLDWVNYICQKYPKKRVVIFSTEMTVPQLKNRLISKVSGINGDYIKQPKLYFLHNGIKITDEAVQEFMQKIEKAKKQVDNYNLVIDDTEEMSVGDIIAKSKKISIKNKDLGIVFVDHAVDVYNSDDEYKNIKKTSSGLRKLAKRLNIPVVVLNQFNSDVKLNKNNGYKPSIYHIYGGGSFRRDCHIILLLWRPGIYPDLIEEKPEFKDINRLIIGKTRETSNIGYVDLNFLGIGFKEK